MQKVGGLEKGMCKGRIPMQKVWGLAKVKCKGRLPMEKAGELATGKFARDPHAKRRRNLQKAREQNDTSLAQRLRRSSQNMVITWTAKHTPGVQVIEKGISHTSSPLFCT